jgi:plasmid stabilization system protein ParE
MRVRYSPRAFADREAIYDYLEKRSPQGAQNVKITIVARDPRFGFVWEPQRRRPAEERGLKKCQKMSTVAGRGALRDLLPDV